MEKVSFQDREKPMHLSPSLPVSRPSFPNAHTTPRLLVPLALDDTLALAKALLTSYYFLIFSSPIRRKFLSKSNVKLKGRVAQIVPSKCYSLGLSFRLGSSCRMLVLSILLSILSTQMYLRNNSRPSYFLIDSDISREDLVHKCVNCYYSPKVPSVPVPLPHM